MATADAQLPYRHACRRHTSCVAYAIYDPEGVSNPLGCSCWVFSVIFGVVGTNAMSTVFQTLVLLLYSNATHRSAWLKVLKHAETACVIPIEFRKDISAI